MIRDRYLKTIFIPLLGILIPAISGLVDYSRDSRSAIIASDLFFIGVSYCVWMGALRIHMKMRNSLSIEKGPFTRIIALCSTSTIYGMVICFLFVRAWFIISKKAYNQEQTLVSVLCCGLAVIFFSLVYEILFLSKERELDSKIVRQLDREKSEAELEVLNNELDPHFMFNSLNTLNHLIMNDSNKAYQFNNKLAQVYKYFLVNKSNSLISLSDELEFIENYFFLYQIRHEEKIELHIKLPELDSVFLIPPFALQIVFENAMKHNQFSEADPLKIRIDKNGLYLNITNNIHLKPYSVPHTGIGLRNLSSRYKLLCDKDISVEKNSRQFSVRLPLIKTM
jgi:two-component system, LytTR family, sensor kinase